MRRTLSLLLVCLFAVATLVTQRVTATSVTVSSTSAVNWLYGSPATLRIYVNAGFWDTDGLYHPVQQTGGPNFYYSATCSVVGTTLTIPSIVLPSTTDSPTNANATYTAVFYDKNGTRRDTWMPNFRVPITTPTTWKDIALFSNSGNAPNPVGYYTAPQVDAKLAGLGVAGKATDVIYGTARLSTPAVLSTAPIVVGDNDPRLQPYNVKLNGLVGNGVADDRAALNTLVNTTIAGATAVVDLSSGSYVIGSNITIPSNVTLRFAAGAKLLISNGVVVTVMGDIDAGPYQIFALPNESTGTGLVRFSATDFQTISARLDEIRPQWWGAIGNNSNDDTLPLQRCINAAIGLPATGVGTPRNADKAINLGSGFIYKITAPITVIGVIGFSMYGGGQENAIIRGFGGTFGTPIESVLDLDGVFEGTFQNFSVEGDVASNYKFLIYYRRDPAFSTRGSSATKFLHIKAGGTWITSGFQIGGSGYFDNYQEDNTTFEGCSARGQWTNGSNYWQRGWYFGTGVLANNLNHTIFGVDAINVKYGITIDNSNVQIYGGEVAGNDVMFYFPNGAVQGYTKVDGIRAEASRKFIEWPGAYSVFFAGEFSNCELQMNNLAVDPVSGTPDWINFGGSQLVLRNIRLLNQNPVTGTATGGSTSTLVKAAAGWAVNAYTGYAVEITAGTGTGQTSYVSSNTSTTLTVSPLLTVAPDSTSQFRLILRPMIRAAQKAIIMVEGVGVEGALLEKAFTLGQYSTAIIRNFSELSVDAEVRTVWSNLSLSGGNYNTLPLATFGASGSLPDIRMSRTTSGVMGLSNFASPTGRIQKLGTPAAPIVDNATIQTGTYTYFLVARDSAGNRSLPSAGTTIVNGPNTLSEADWVRIYPPNNTNALPVVSYDILKGTTATSLALNVPIERMMEFRDIGQPTAAYSAPTVDATGVLTIDQQLAMGGVTFANLGTPASGRMVYCSNCNIATPCTTGGAGAWAFRTAAGTWNCPF